MTREFKRSRKFDKMSRTIIEASVQFPVPGRERMDNRKTPVKKKIFIEDRIPFLGGRPERDRAIGHEDIIDLEIILNTNATVDAIIDEL
jgi:hypothetical protein